jgi:glyceraldehyde 3-phosphate dehydrogenase
MESINETLEEAAQGAMMGILVFCGEPLVSSDFRGNPASSIVDGLSTVVLDGKMAKVLSWYDNEWGYSCRVADLAMLMANKGV